MRTGYAYLPLHWGKCPRWLFDKMKLLGSSIAEIIVLEFGKDEFLKRISDPFFFQALGCIIGFDWHSSGLTTTVCGALKEGISEDVGIAFLGGKGKAGREVPSEIEKISNVFSFSSSKINELKYASRMAAKVDSSCVQDGYRLYFHSFVVSESGKWAVIQQGLNENNCYARRYHWVSEKVKSFVREPQTAVCCDVRGCALNMVDKKSDRSQKVCVDIIRDVKPNKLKKLILSSCHSINLHQYKHLKDAYEYQPRNFEELVSLRGIGPKSIRALALISALIYGEEPSWNDPVNFSFAHGGKDNYPYPIDKKNYDKSIQILQAAIENAKIGNKEKLRTLRRLKSFLE